MYGKHDTYRACITTVVAVKLISLLRVVVCILARITRVLFVICRRAMHKVHQVIYYERTIIMTDQENGAPGQFCSACLLGVHSSIIWNTTETYEY